MESGRVDLCYTVSGYVQIHVVVDGISKVGQLSTIAAIVEYQVLAQTGIGFAHIKVLIGNAVYGLFASYGHTGSVAVKVVGIAPHIEGDVVPTGFIVYEDCETVVLNLWFCTYLLDTIGSDAQIDVAVDGKVEVG